MKMALVSSLYLSFVVFAGAPVAAQEAETLPGAMEMASALVRYHPYLFTEADRAELDGVNRDLREAQQQARRASTDGQRQAATAKREAAAARLQEILAACPAARDITLSGERTTLPALDPMTLPGDSGALLFRVTTGGGPARCLTLDYDLSEHSQYRLPVDVAPDCVTWVLLSLNRVPQLRTSMEVEFAVAGQPATILPLQTVTPDHGTLRVTVLSDDTGKPAPAMMRIVWESDGREIRPSNALDFGPQFDHQGNWDGARNARLPGELAGAYWCVPAPFTMELAPGDYDVTMLRGTEHVAVKDTVSVASNALAERTYRPRRWVDMRKFGWYSGDDHVHTQILSDADGKTVMTWIQAEDVHLANIVKMGDIYRTWFEQRGFGKSYRVVDGDYVLSPGQECPRTHNELGHTISMNIQDMIRNTDQYYLYDTVFDEAHRQGGLSGYAHVNAVLFHVHRDMSINIPKEKIDFVELLQFANLGTDLYYDFLNTGFKVTASAGSDVPWGGSVGEVRVYAYTGKKKFNADRWFEAVRKGNTFVTNGIMLDFTVNGALPGDEISVDGDAPLRVKARAWGDPERCVPSKLDVIVHGKPVNTAESSDAGQSELTLDFAMPPGNGFWIAARAEGTDGSRAHTTPIYVVREGLRFWKYDGIQELISKRETSLAEIEQIVAEAIAQNDAGQVEDNRTIKQLALQGPELLVRVAEAKQIYTELRGTAEREAALRR